MLQPCEDESPTPAPVGMPLSTSSFSRSAGSFTAQHPMVDTETLPPVSGALRNSTVIDAAHMCSALTSSPQSSMDAMPSLRATETRLRQAQEAELSVLLRLRAVTEALLGIVPPSNPLDVACVATTAEHCSGDAGDVSALGSGGAFRASLPALITCPLSTRAEKVTCVPAEAHVVMKCVFMPSLGLSAAAREQYSALQHALARHFRKLEDGVVDGTGVITASDACTSTNGTPETPQTIRQYEVNSSMLDSQITEVVATSSTDALTAQSVSDYKAGASNNQYLRHHRTVEAQRRTCFFSKLRSCSPSPPQPSVSPRQQHASTATCGPRKATAEAHMGSGSASLDRRVANSLPSSHAQGFSDVLVDTNRRACAVAMALTLPKRSPVDAENSCTESGAKGERKELREEERGQTCDEANEATLPSCTPAVAPSFTTVLACEPTPCVLMIDPSTPLSPCILPLSAHGASTGGAWESSEVAAPDGQQSQDSPTPPALQLSPHRPSRALSATPTSAFGDTDEEGMYFPTPPPVKAHRRAEDDPALSSRLSAMSNGGSAFIGAGGASAFSTKSTPTALPTALRRCLVSSVDYDELNAEPTSAPRSEKRGRVAASSSMHMVDGACKDASQTVSAAHVMRLPAKSTCVVTATDILATITPLPSPSSSSLLPTRALARRAHCRGKDIGATRRVNVLPAEGEPAHRGAYKRIRGRGDEYGDIGVSDEVQTAVPLAGLPSLGVDVSWSAATESGRWAFDETSDGRHGRSVTARRTEMDSHRSTVLEEEHVPRGYVRTREQRIEDFVRTERVFGALRATCRPLLPASSQTSPHCPGANTECDEVVLSPSPPLSQDTPRQFWDISFF
ncbi:hypothetical protein, conserved [Leishmania tarentolae]|uniref:Uncharacterized protein n=1 Tax=Leishmania tarentolae TaxID=5689 RepID=A0A640KK36_LEITA|nr:hypothetical protein, conserved [Leishmania tarentolae]